MLTKLFKKSSRGSHKQERRKKLASYEYQPLRKTDSIRLLRLGPGRGDDPIHCSLFEVALGKRPSYEAISYAWGDPSEKGVVFCNRKAVSVTRNLVEALRIFRYRYTSRILWADAICINQADLGERGYQVQLMARIYSEAAKVLIWLGHCDPSMVQVAFNYICLLLNHRDKYRLLANGCVSYLWHSKQVDMSKSDTISPDATPDNETLEALRTLFACPYFLRGWIIQEVVLPTTAEVFWDQARLNFLWLYKAARSLRRLYDAQFRENAYFGLVALNNIRRFHLAIHGFPKQYTFCDLLTYTRHHSFNHPKDYIYGLLGLQGICPDLSLIRPDYNASDLDCYKAVVEDLLINRGDFNILSLILHREEIDGEWPSWVPRLDCRMNYVGNYALWNASGDVEATLSKQVHDGCEYMRIRGLCVDGLKTIVGKNMFPDGKEVQALLHWLEHRHGAKCVAWTVTAGYIGGQPLPHESTLRPPSLKAIQAHLDGDTTKSRTVLDHPRFARGMNRLRNYDCHSRSRRFFETHEGLLGCGPNLMEPGDSVVVLFGAEMPFVVRPVGTSWRLVGVCHVYGIMEGEAVDRWQNGTKYTAEDFDIF